jgi:aryl-alcohol dehydrogenase-like predicted oxidoreductase
MDHRRLGDSDLDVSVIALGSWLTYCGGVGRKQTEACTRAGLTMPQLALAWVLRRPNVAAAIVGATRPEQVRENVAAAGVELSGDTLAALDDALDPWRCVKGSDPLSR